MLKTALEKLFASTGRTLLFMFLALMAGMLATLASSVPAVIRFGALFGGALIVTFVSSLTLLPALLQLLQPRFLTAHARKADPASPAKPARRSSARVATLVAVLGLGLAVPAGAEPPVSAGAAAPDPSWLSGIDVAKKINARDEGAQATSNLTIELTDRSGKKRLRETRSFRKSFGTERRIAFFYESPQSVAGTAFLTRDYPEPDRDDDQWIYLPASGKVRRIASSDRGGYFIETDFTYDDISRDSKVRIEDYNWKTIGMQTIDGVPHYVVESIPVDEATAQELGYGRVVSYVDTKIWFARKVEYYDVRGNPLKVLQASDIRQVQGIWTAHSVEMKQLKTGHNTVLKLSNVDYKANVKDELFDQRTLQRGAR